MTRASETINKAAHIMRSVYLIGAVGLSIALGLTYLELDLRIGSGFKTITLLLALMMLVAGFRPIKLNRKRFFEWVKATPHPTKIVVLLLAGYDLVIINLRTLVTGVPKAVNNHFYMFDNERIIKEISRKEFFDIVGNWARFEMASTHLVLIFTMILISFFLFEQERLDVEHS